MSVRDVVTIKWNCFADHSVVITKTRLVSSKYRDRDIRDYTA